MRTVILGSIPGSEGATSLGAVDVLTWVTCGSDFHSQPIISPKMETTTPPSRGHCDYQRPQCQDVTWADDECLCFLPPRALPHPLHLSLVAEGEATGSPCMVTIQTLEDSQEPRPGLLTLMEESPLLLEPQFLWLHSER